jgi:uncharacterized SAM-binding protein YcdF (DUF218 family)
MSIFKLIAGVILNVAIFGGLLFLPAGTLDWWCAWVFLGVVFVGAVASTISLFRLNKELLEERFKPPLQKGQPLVDKIVVAMGGLSGRSTGHDCRSRAAILFCRGDFP